MSELGGGNIYGRGHRKDIYACNAVLRSGTIYTSGPDYLPSLIYS